MYAVHAGEGMLSLSMYSSLLRKEVAVRPRDPDLGRLNTNTHPAPTYAYSAFLLAPTMGFFVSGCAPVFTGSQSKNQRWGLRKKRVPSIYIKERIRWVAYAPPLF